MTIQDLRLYQLMLDGGTQARAKLDFRYIAKLVDDIKEGATLEPVIVFFDGAKYWLADGFHRARAVADAGLKVIRAEIRSGDRRAALLFGLIAATDLEAHRTRLDKRRAVTLVLADSEWSCWSNQEIARKLKVSLPFVSGARKSFTEGKEHRANIKNGFDQGNPPVFDARLESLEEEGGIACSSDDVALPQSAERCMLIDPYLATPEIIAQAIEELKAHYYRITGKAYKG